MPDTRTPKEKYDLIGIAGELCRNTSCNPMESREQWISLMYSMADGGPQMESYFLTLASRASPHRGG